MPSSFVPRESLPRLLRASAETFLALRLPDVEDTATRTAVMRTLECIHARAPKRVIGIRAARQREPTVIRNRGGVPPETDRPRLFQLDRAPVATLCLSHRR